MGYNGNGFKKGYKQSDKHRENLKVAKLESKNFNRDKKKVCIKGHPYTSENIYVNKKGLRSCLICRKDKNRLYRENNHEKHLAENKKWVLRNPERVRTTGWKNNLKKNYGLTIEQYQDMLEKQGGVCLICGKTETKRRLSVDHDHSTGKVRGLLCNHCNHVLGLSYENINILQSAIIYLNNSKQK